MAIDAQLAGKRAYLDSNIFIYAFENVGVFGAACAVILALVDRGVTKAVTSEISLVEILVGPLMAGNHALAALYVQRLETAPGLELVPISRSIILRSASIRASRRLKIPDAMHVAAAIETGCDLLVTADAGIQGSVRLPVVHVTAPAA